MAYVRYFGLLIGLLALSLAGAAQSEEAPGLIEGRVVIVHDGDHISVRTQEGNVYSIRFQGIDAPETDQPYGKRSRKKLSDMVLNKDVKVIVHKRDAYDRLVGTVYLNGMDVGIKQVESGMAWHFKRFSGEQASDVRARYARAELKARNDRTGLWSDRAPIPPWEFREEEFAADPDPDVDEAAPQTAVKETAVPDVPVQPTDQQTPPADTSGPKPAATRNGREYFKGPRGGCYYVNARGTKVYVKDKSLCEEQ